MYKVKYTEDYGSYEEYYFLKKENAIKKAKNLFLKSLAETEIDEDWDGFEKIIKQIDEGNYFDDFLEIEECIPDDEEED